MTDRPDELTRRLLPVLQACCTGSRGIALGGSHAKNRNDSFSDVDIYLFSTGVLSAGERTKLVQGTVGEQVQVASWGSGEAFVQAGTDFTYSGWRVECWFRSIGHIGSTIDACLQGDIQREYVGWTVMGFFNHAVLSDLDAMQIIEDADGVLAGWKAMVKSYPEPLRQAILRRSMQEALFWRGNPHYIFAIERVDYIYTSGIVQQVLHALIQVIFALNREYFPGEKNLEGSVAKLRLQPLEFGPRLKALLAVSEPTIVYLREQERALSTLVEDVDQLVRGQNASGA